MRTTIELEPEHRSALLSIAAQRGQKGFSGVIKEAIDEYLSKEQARVKKRKALLSLCGSISEKDAKELRELTSAIRRNWR